MTNKENHDAYRRFATYYDGLVGKHYYNNLSDLFTKFMRHFPEKTHHLDIGCGTGYLLRHSQAMNFIVQGIDISKEMISIARRNNPGINIYQGNIMDFNKKSFSIITANNDVLNHICSAYGLHRVFTHINQILLPGGIFFSDAVSAYDILHNWENCTHLYTDHSVFKCNVKHKIIDESKPTGLMTRHWEFNINGKWEKSDVESEVVRGITPEEIIENSLETGFIAKLFDWDKGGSCKPDTIRIGIHLKR